MKDEGHLTINADCKVTTNAEAVAARLCAERIRLKSPDQNPYFAEIDTCLANRLEAAANAHLALIEMPECGAGGEFIPAGFSEVSITRLELNNPDRIAVDASLDRVELAHKNGILNMALDTSEAIGAKNGAEQMLAHQMAAIHRMSLDLMAEAGNTRDPIEKCRLLNTSARLMETYQKGLLTINRLKTGGQQTVTVQHVQVSDGGQAVINGSVGDRGRG